jgi:hypothetical protein
LRDIQQETVLKKVLIITPHFPPSNLAAVHRSRLFAQHLPSFGWQPVILTVDEKYYEEKLDHILAKLLPQDLVIEKVKAFPVTKPRMIGDIGIRAFFQLYKRAKKIIKTQEIDFLYLPIPSFYVALLGRWLHKSTGVPYGIDYIDPWVHSTPEGNKFFSRHWFSERIANWLEPIAVRKASVITGVAQGYYEGVIERNPHLKQQAIFGAMPYGGEKADHESVKQMKVNPYLFEPRTDKIQLVYAGAMLPKAYAPLESIFQAMKDCPEQFSNLEIHFIGTGKTANDPNGFNIRPLAEKYDLWQKVVFEYPKRIPYVDVLIHLEAARGVFILGSTEKHYTPSKVYQGILSGKPLIAVLHRESTAVEVIRQSNAGIVMGFDGENELDLIKAKFPALYQQYITFLQSFNRQQVNMDSFNQYSARAVTCKLAELLDEAVSKS